jgi:hypothetical protein
MDISRQIDVSLPPAAVAGEVDLEIVELLFNTRGISVERVVSSNASNPFNQQFTLQLKNIQGIEKLLQTTDSL